MRPVPLLLPHSFHPSRPPPPAVPQNPNRSTHHDACRHPQRHPPPHSEEEEEDPHPRDEAKGPHTPHRHHATHGRSLLPFPRFIPAAQALFDELPRPDAPLLLLVPRRAVVRVLHSRSLWRPDG